LPSKSQSRASILEALLKLGISRMPCCTPIAFPSLYSASHKSMGLVFEPSYSLIFELFR
jgi:hypothetical protein